MLCRGTSIEQQSSKSLLKICSANSAKVEGFGQCHLHRFHWRGREGRRGKKHGESAPLPCPDYAVPCSTAQSLALRRRWRSHQHSWAPNCRTACDGCPPDRAKQVVYERGVAAHVRWAGQRLPRIPHSCAQAPGIVAEWRQVPTPRPTRCKVEMGRICSVDRTADRDGSVGTDPWEGGISKQIINSLFALGESIDRHSI